MAEPSLQRYGMAVTLTERLGLAGVTTLANEAVFAYKEKIMAEHRRGASVLRWRIAQVCDYALQNAGVTLYVVFVVILACTSVVVLVYSTGDFSHKILLSLVISALLALVSFILLLLVEAKFLSHEFLRLGSGRWQSLPLTEFRLQFLPNNLRLSAIKAQSMPNIIVYVERFGRHGWVVAKEKSFWGTRSKQYLGYIDFEATCP